VLDSPLAGFPIPPAQDGLAFDVQGNVYVPVSPALPLSGSVPRTHSRKPILYDASLDGRK
jgi:hypothetical protein